MKSILEYLDKLPPDKVGESWTLITYIMNDLGLSREEIYEKVMEAREEGFVQIVKTNQDGPEGLLSVGIVERGRLYLRREDYSHLLNPNKNRVPYNL
jgi:hypothetical protein